MRSKAVPAALLALLAAPPPAWAAPAAAPAGLGEEARAVLGGSRFQRDLPLAPGTQPGGVAPGRGNGPGSAGDVDGPPGGDASGARDDDMGWRKLVERLQQALGRESEKGESRQQRTGGPAESGREHGSGPQPSSPAPRAQLPELPDVSPAVAAGASSFGTVLLIVFAAVALGLLAAWILRLVANRKRAPQAAAAKPAVVASPAAPPPTVDEAARLAGLGLHGEAVHLLLLTAIERLFARGRGGPAAAETGRELAARLPAHGDARPAFTALVAASERYLFGGIALGPDDYEASRADFRRAVAEGAR